MTAPMTNPTANPIALAPIVLVDHREKAPYSFGGLRSPEVVTRGVQLDAGDYSLSTCPGQVAVERKELSDLFRTVAHGRKRFAAELDKLNGISRAAVIVESVWDEIIANPPGNTRLAPAAVVAAIRDWKRRFPRVDWLFVDGRREAEKETLRALEAFAFAHDAQG